MFFVNIINIKLNFQKVENILNFVGNFKIMILEVLDYIYNFQIENFIYLKGFLEYQIKVLFKVIKNYNLRKIVYCQKFIY